MSPLGISPSMFLKTAVVLLLLDLVYLTFFKSFFAGIVKKIQGGQPMQFRLLGAALCYIFLILGLNYFVLAPGKSWKDAFWLGLVIYGVYETTTYSVLHDWPISAVLLDTVWGGTLFALTTFIITTTQRYF